jgi:solute carrier family 7 (L-type amino acid transporter), member 8
LCPLTPQTFANRLYGYMAWIIPVFVAMSTFGAVNGVLLTSSRYRYKTSNFSSLAYKIIPRSLFYAGACEGQMPEILTMIQINRRTPAPAVLTIVIKNSYIIAFF